MLFWGVSVVTKVVCKELELSSDADYCRSTRSADETTRRRFLHPKAEARRAFEERVAFVAMHLCDRAKNRCGQLSRMLAACVDLIIGL